MSPRTPGGGRCRLVRTLALGVCGTDREILNGIHGSPPPGEQRLVLGHESLGTVMAASEQSGLLPGDLVVGIVRRPDPEPCVACAEGEWDMCRNGRYTERGIKERHGYGAERFRIEPEFAVKIDPDLGILGVLLEPASILAKAWDHAERIGRARVWQPQTLLVTGAGPIGLLAALMGTQRGLEVHVLDRNKGGEGGDRARSGRHLSQRLGEPRAARARRVDGMHRSSCRDLWLSRGGGRGRHRLPDRRHRAGEEV